MSDIQWGITTIIGILGILAGRVWQRFEYKKSKDIKMISRFDEMVPFFVINFIHEHDFGESFDNDLLVKIQNIIENYKKPDFLFINQKLQKNSQEFIKNLIIFSRLLALNSGPIDNPKYSRVPLVYDRPTESEIETIQQLEGIADELFRKYSEIKKTAQKEL